MPHYILRNIKPDLWVAVKARAKDEGLSIRVVIFALLEAYADRKCSVSATITTKTDPAWPSSPTSL